MIIKFWPATLPFSIKYECILKSCMGFLRFLKVSIINIISLFVKATRAGVLYEINGAS